MFACLLLCSEFLFLEFLFLVECVYCFYGLVNCIFHQGGNSCIVADDAVMAGFYFHWWLLVDARGRFNDSKETLIRHFLYDESHGVGGYLCHPPIYNVVGLVISWCLTSFVVGDGDSHDELVYSNLGELVAVAIGFVPIIDELSETGALSGLGKLI